MILIRSVQLWWPGLDFKDEVWFIRHTLDYFQKGQLSENLKMFPANIPFVAIFYVFYLVWPNVETFELLVFFVYPLLVIGYYLMAKEIMNLYRKSSTPAIPAIMFFSFAPTVSIIPTYYWPKLLGLAALFFSCATLLHLLSSEHRKDRQWVIVIVSSTVLVFSHSISTALFILTILFLYITCEDRAKRWILLRIGVFTFLMLTVAQYNFYSSYLRRIMSVIQGDITVMQFFKGHAFSSIESIFRTGPIVTLAHTGFIIVVGSLILLRAYRILNHRSLVTKQPKNRFAELLNLLKSDTILFSYTGFGVLSFIFAFFLSGLYLDPIRMISWAALFAFPVIIPSKKSNALLFMVILLTLFFLLVWTTNAPWGSPFGYAHGLNIP